MTRFGILSFGIVLGLAWLVGLLGYYSRLPGFLPLDFMLFRFQIVSAMQAWQAGDVALHVWGTKGPDTIFLALYGVVLTAVAIWYWQGRLRALMLVLVWVAVGADYVENHYNLRLLAGQGGVGPHLVASWVKFLAIAPPMNWGLVLWFREIRARRVS
ncbi:hypothetical protein ACMU_14720 [Actibacterium mucosum KCTC 23349]|uniref:Uncharacterized protein n=1 Tax=Actibacterium mucosum KCTC 23349 TaxID=1454373 RepID=A0A037ZHJ5_9RHOB|nr:hypothetical protein [Actibacterium mucosum]KAJ55007.1 hypothetical protein ACMU_14720 [Actibacterium mucosum KCTC 23349]